MYTVLCTGSECEYKCEYECEGECKCECECECKCEYECECKCEYECECKCKCECKYEFKCENEYERVCACIYVARVTIKQTSEQADANIKKQTSTKKYEVRIYLIKYRTQYNLVLVNPLSVSVSLVRMQRRMTRTYYHLIYNRYGVRSTELLLKDTLCGC